MADDLVGNELRRFFKLWIDRHPDYVDLARAVKDAEYAYDNRFAKVQFDSDPASYVYECKETEQDAEYTLKEAKKNANDGWVSLRRKFYEKNNHRVLDEDHVPFP